MEGLLALGTWSSLVQDLFQSILVINPWSQPCKLWGCGRATFQAEPGDVGRPGAGGGK